MKRSIFVLNFIFLILCWSQAFSSSEQSSDLSDEETLTYEATPAASFSKMIRFDPIPFLREAAAQAEHNSEKNRILAFANNPNRLEHLIIPMCWDVLIYLKDQALAHKKVDDLSYCYLTMAKLFLSTNSYPEFEISPTSGLFDTEYPEERRNRLNDYLRRRMDIVNLDSQKLYPNIYKRTLLYKGMLCMYYIEKNLDPDSDEERETINGLALQALIALIKASELKPTKSVHALLAHLYLEHGALIGLELEDRQKKAEDQLKLFYTNEKEKNKNPAARSKENGAKKRTFWERSSRPPYYTDRLVQQDVEELYKRLGPDLIGPQVEPINLTLMPEHEVALLPHRVIAPEYCLEKKRNSKIDGRVFTEYDVSGKDFRCLFNSMGLTDKAQVKLLLQNKKNALIRAMIANEIVAGWRDYYLLLEPVRQSLQVRHLLERQARVDRLVESNRQQELREELENEQNLILTQLRARASTEAVFESYVRHQIGTRIDNDPEQPYPMMVLLQDVEGEDETHLPNLSTGDAIAHLNNLGLRIYGPSSRLMHAYIPQNATEIVNIRYHKSRLHFTALVPQSEESEEESNGMGGDQVNDNLSELDRQIQQAYDEAVPSGAFSQNLSALLQQRFSTVVNKTKESDDHVRLVLFFNSLQKSQREISQMPLIVWKNANISNILRANGIKDKDKFDEGTMHSIFEACFSILPRAEGKKGTTARLIAQHLGLDYKDVEGFIRNTLLWETKKIVELSPERQQEIVDLYTQGHKICEIRNQTNVPFKSIFETLSAKVPLEDRTKVLEDEEIDQVVYKNKSIQERNQKMREFWVSKGWDKAPNKTQHYHDLAKFFDVTDRLARATIAGEKDKENEKRVAKKGQKRKHTVTREMIEAAYQELTPEEKQNNPLGALSKVLNMTEQGLALAKKVLEKMGVETNGSGVKKRKKTTS